MGRGISDLGWEILDWAAPPDWDRLRADQGGGGIVMTRSGGPLTYLDVVRFIMGCAESTAGEVRDSPARAAAALKEGGGIDQPEYVFVKRRLRELAGSSPDDVDRLLREFASKKASACRAIRRLVRRGLLQDAPWRGGYRGPPRYRLTREGLRLVQERRAVGTTAARKRKDKSAP